MSYVMEGLLGFILFRCSSYILQTPFFLEEGWGKYYELNALE